MENKPGQKSEKLECGEDFKKSVADLVKSGLPPGAAVAEARKKHGVDMEAKHKNKPAMLKMDDGDDMMGGGM